MISEAELCQARRSPRSIMDIYGYERALIKAPALMGRGGAAEGASFRDASRKARRSTACADETKLGPILPGKNPRFLLGQHHIIRQEQISRKFEF